ncbi:hypothetical protein B0H17DRAFT_1150279 [Mycena rosella]|uniref:Uncharacterized protein n=1 Tax=Mycena rosella TaxID=1033263 RepID=A0AAD7FPT8_MYCRO|nr:hypothetical protein B0H17DRAFT_1150279 [Mycena rosella]
MDLHSSNFRNAPGSPLQHIRGTATAGGRFARANLPSPLRPLSNMLLDRPACPYPPSSFAALATLRPSRAPQVAAAASQSPLMPVPSLRPHQCAPIRLREFLAANCAWRFGDSQPNGHNTFCEALVAVAFGIIPAGQFLWRLRCPDTAKQPLTSIAAASGDESVFVPTTAALAAKNWQKCMRWGEYPEGYLPQGCSGGVRRTPDSAIIPIVSTYEILVGYNVF